MQQILSQHMIFQHSIPYILRDNQIKTLNSVRIIFQNAGPPKKISINNYSMANWCKSSKQFVFDTISLKRAVKYLIRNCYFAIGDQVFQHIIGITMQLVPANFHSLSFFILL